MAARPLIETKVLTEFGEVVEDANFHSARVGEDHTFVPGYSDLRKARDLAIATELKRTGGRHDMIDWKNVPTLPVRLQWTRDMRVAGNEPDSTKEIQMGNDGYRKVTKADIGQEWLKELPAGAKVVAGGAIRKGDVTLMVCDKQNAARNAARVQIETMRQVTDNSKTPLLVKGADSQGAEPYMERTLADKPIGA